jgi:hypothetical protein
MNNDKNDKSNDIYFFNYRCLAIIDDKIMVIMARHIF